MVEVVRFLEHRLFAVDLLRKRLQEENVEQTVAALSLQEILNTPLDQLVERVADAHTVVPLELHSDEVFAITEESSIPPASLLNGQLPDVGESWAPGHAVYFHIAFTGDADLFNQKPDECTLQHPQGRIREKELVFCFISREVGLHIQQAYERELDSVRGYLDCQRAMIEHHNKSTREAARRHLQDRIKRIQQADAGAAALGVPVRRRADAPMTYAAPEIRRRLPTAAPTIPKTRDSRHSEPTLPDAEYTHILKVMRSMAIVLERSPSAFEAIGEEGIRWHFIVQLNAQYEGQATGETFNFKGKTDILVRSGERNIFIAECKFWKGAEAFSNTLDQLLGYLTWRDTKAAIVIFNRNVQLSTVLAAVPNALRNHSSCCTDIVRDDETSFSTMLTRPDDPERKIVLTVMVFDVPKKKAVS